MKPRHRPGPPALAALLAAAPALAHAHGDLQGLAPFYAGMLHPLLVPAQLVALLALGLLAGQSRLGTARLALALLLLALIMSLPAAAAWTVDTAPLLLAAALALALAVVAARPLPRSLLVLLALAVGAGIGLGSSPETVAGPARWAWLAGSGIGAFASSALVAALADAARPSWARIGVRVAGSWLAASALLVLALRLAGAPA